MRVRSSQASSAEPWTSPIRASRERRSDRTKAATTAPEEVPTTTEASPGFHSVAMRSEKRVPKWKAAPVMPPPPSTRPTRDTPGILGGGGRRQSMRARPKPWPHPGQTASSSIVALRPHGQGRSGLIGSCSITRRNGRPTDAAKPRMRLLTRANTGARGGLTRAGMRYFAFRRPSPVARDPLWRGCQLQAGGFSSPPPAPCLLPPAISAAPQMSLTLTLPDGKTLDLPEGSTGADAARKIGRRLAEAAVAVRLNGVALDLSRPLPYSGALEVITVDSEEGRHVLRHSAAHVLAQAVLGLFEGATFAIGPPIEDGFYYDFDIGRAFTAEDLERIEARMVAIVAEDQSFERLEMSKSAALKMFAH